MNNTTRYSQKSLLALIALVLVGATVLIVQSMRAYEPGSPVVAPRGVSADGIGRGVIFGGGLADSFSS